MSEIPKKPEIGDEIMTDCRKCKSEMHHVVTAIKDGVVKKVMCKGCNTTHVYKDKNAKPKKKAAAKKEVDGETKVKKPRRRIRKYDWDALSVEIEEEELIDYKLDIDLTEARGVRHNNFGIGVITKVLSHNQIEVLFKEEVKILVHNYVVQS